MKLRVLRLYDDAWGTGQVLSGAEADEIGKQGAFPIVSSTEFPQLASSVSVIDTLQVCVSEGSTLASGASSTASH